MEPIPETGRAIDEFGPFAEVDLREHLQDMAARVLDVVPECVGISLASREHGVSFTLVASDDEIAALDGVQYLDGGPCVDGVEVDEVIEYREGDPLGESRWQMFARATAVAGIESTLTLPVLAGEEVAGSVNLYAATPDAFAGHHDDIAVIFGAWAPGAVTNADLGFSTRGTAEQAPQLLYEDVRLQIAVGVVMTTQDVDTDTAREKIRRAARRAGITEATLAEQIIAGVPQAEQALDE